MEILNKCLRIRAIGYGDSYYYYYFRSQKVVEYYRSVSCGRGKLLWEHSKLSYYFNFHHKELTLIWNCKSVLLVASNLTNESFLLKREKDEILYIAKWIGFEEFVKTVRLRRDRTLPPTKAPCEPITNCFKD